MNRHATLAGIGLVCLVLGLTTATGFVGYHVVSNRIHASKVRAELQQICRAVCDQRDNLMAAISKYKEAYGFYPPDHLLAQSTTAVEAITNQLFYELIGCARDRTQAVYLPASSSDRLPLRLVREFFGRDITNSVDTPGEPKGFLLSTKAPPQVQIHDRPESIVLMSYCPNWNGFDGDLTGFQIGTWEYNSSSPRHNTGAYDLWLEIKTAETNIVIGNW
jgi:hypothetical protein